MMQYLVMFDQCNYQVNINGPGINLSIWEPYVDFGDHLDCYDIEALYALEKKNPILSLS